MIGISPILQWRKNFLVDLRNTFSLVIVGSLVNWWFMKEKVYDYVAPPPPPPQRGNKHSQKRPETERECNYNNTEKGPGELVKKDSCS